MVPGLPGTAARRRRADAAGLTRMAGCGTQSDMLVLVFSVHTVEMVFHSGSPWSARFLYWSCHLVIRVSECVQSSLTCLLPAVAVKPVGAASGA